MNNAKVKTHKRKGRVVRAHVRTTKPAGAGAQIAKVKNIGSGNSGSEIAAKAKAMNAPLKKAAHPHRVKGSSAAKAHMAKIRAMIGKNK
jgi:hypothetical protein